MDRLWLRQCVPRAGIAALAAASLAFGTVIPVAGAAPPPCPSGGTPAPGSTVQGPLVVDGPCILQNVTVNGNVTVTSGAGLELENSTVKGNISVQPDGELDVGHTLNSFVVTYTPNTITGSVILDHARDFDLAGATIDGSVTVTGLGSGGDTPTVCGTMIGGSFKVQDVATAPSMTFGDPGESSYINGVCRANVIAGAVLLSNDASPIEVEGNTITGSATIRHSAVEFSGNAVGGSLLCSNGGSLSSSDADATAGNQVRGANTCPSPQ